MKSTKMLTISALILMTWLVGLSEAAPMGTAWTYQGRLIDANYPADGLYDFQFKLFDANVAGTQQGSTIDINDLDVIDGYFTVEFDFGSDVFNGDARWLETTVMNADGSDPCKLRPRQLITPLPYALQTRGIFVDSTGNVGIGNTSPTSLLDVEGQITATALKGHNMLDIESPMDIEFTIDSVDNPSIFAFFELFNGKGTNLWSVNENGDMRVTGNSYLDGNVGIGTMTPTTALDVVGTVNATAFVGDGSGLWNLPGGSVWGVSGANVYYATGNVGIGTTDPGAKLEVLQSTWPDIVKIGTASSDNRLIFSSGFTWASISGSTTNRDDITILHSNGNVGIGTTTPTTALDVVGTVNATAFVGDGSGLWNLPGGSVWTVSGANVYYATGNVGVGTTTPGARLDVRSSTELKTAQIINSDSSGIAYGVNVLATGAGGTHHYAGRFQASGATHNYAIYADGTNSKSYFQGSVGIGTVYPNYTLHVVGDAGKTVGGAYWTSISDRNLKDDIKPLEGALDRLTRLQGRTFKWKDAAELNAEEGTHIGLVAQEVEEVFPQWVSEDNQGRKQVTLEGLEAVTIEAIKELKRENELLKKRLEILEKKLNANQLAVDKEVQ